MQAVRPLVIAYDIRKNKSRYRVLKILRKWGVLGNQKSVYEFRLKLRDAEELLLQISAYLDPETDSLLAAWLEHNRQVLVRGTGEDSIRRELWYME